MLVSSDGVVDDVCWRPGKMAAGVLCCFAQQEAGDGLTCVSLWSSPSVAVGDFILQVVRDVE